ncbi:hypothetical protein [Flavobacterium sp. W22_SRS_FP1]|uniref:hypothetical protein n=1 Tax=Flavobacterium sp. W22_SRS_FP1 TaxID=3240276 RepID=UPI003F8E39B7
MIILKRTIPLYLLVLSLFISCTTKDDEVNLVSSNTPTPSTLIFPENNTECNEGNIVSETESDVLFKWEETKNTGSYLLTIKNLNTGLTREIKTVSNEFLIRVLRGTPYSWEVISKAITGNETANSETWKFYNAGLPEESHSPFPAEAISPKIGSNVNEGIIQLQWLATDVDNDIVSYKVLMDTSTSPSTEVGNITVNSLNVTVSSGKVYYWKVITEDVTGNASHSQVFQFKVN